MLLVSSEIQLFWLLFAYSVNILVIIGGNNWKVTSQTYKQLFIWVIYYFPPKFF